MSVLSRFRRPMTRMGLLGVVPLVAVAMLGGQPASAMTPPVSQPSVDALWWATDQLQACQNPVQDGNLGDCFSGQYRGFNVGPFTDGVNVYAGYTALKAYGGQVCSLSGLAQSGCQAFGNEWLFSQSLAAYGGNIYSGALGISGTNDIHSCPVSALTNITAASFTIPSACSLLDTTPKDEKPVVMLAVPDHLYIGLKPTKTKRSLAGLIWSCPLTVANACSTLDNSGQASDFSYPASPQSFAYGAGYLWVGLTSGILWRCDPDTANACTNWAELPSGISSLSLDGAGNIYAVAGSIYECPVATQTSGACPKVVSGSFGTGAVSSQNGVQIAANENGVFGNQVCSTGGEIGRAHV